MPTLPLTSVEESGAAGVWAKTESGKASSAMPVRTKRFIVFPLQMTGSE
jgi:hypothetical protein